MTSLSNVHNKKAATIYNHNIIEERQISLLLAQTKPLMTYFQGRSEMLLTYFITTMVIEDHAVIRVSTSTGNRMVRSSGQQSTNNKQSKFAPSSCSISTFRFFDNLVKTRVCCLCNAVVILHPRPSETAISTEEEQHPPPAPASVMMLSRSARSQLVPDWRNSCALL